MDAKERLDVDAAVLLVIDVQNDYCHPDGACAKAGDDVSSAVEMVPRLERLLDGARAAGVPLVWIRTGHDAFTDTPAWLSKRTDPRRRAHSPRIARLGSWGAEFYRVAPLPTEAVIRKTRYSGFAGTNLDQILRGMGRPSLLFTGVASNICVESTLREALFHEYYVTLVEDCCAAYDPAMHEATKRNVAENFGYVQTSDAALARWLLGSSREGSRSGWESASVSRLSP